jgi:preprotein translocase subunit SecG
MQTAIWILNVLAALGVIGLVLLQHGKGADMGAAFGSGSAGSLFGAAGASNFMSRATAILAAVFFISSLGLTYFSSRSHQGGVMRGQETQQQQQKPAAAPEQKKESAPAPNAPAKGSKADEIPK